MARSTSAVVVGTYNAICDECGWKYKANEMRKRWDNAFVCSPCWETRHPQDFLRSVKEKQRVPNPRPDTTNYQTTQVTVDDL